MSALRSIADTADCVAPCPTCGGPLAGHAGISVDLGFNEAVIDGRAIRLGPADAAILNILVERMPRLVTRDALLLRIYGADGGPIGAETVLTVRIYRLRKALRGTRLLILTAIGEGYAARLTASFTPAALSPPTRKE